MDVELTAQRRALLTEAGYTVPPRGPRASGRLRAHDTTGAAVDLRVVATPDGDRSTWVATLGRWASVDDPGLEPLLDVLDLGDAVALLHPAADGLTLTGVVATHGRLDVLEGATLLRELGRTLARLHADGHHYGPMTPDDVLVVDHAPLLAVPAPTERTVLAPSAEEDAYQLAALVASVLAPSIGTDGHVDPQLRALHRLVTSAVGDRRTRPGVGTLAAAAHELVADDPAVRGLAVHGLAGQDLAVQGLAATAPPRPDDVSEPPGRDAVVGPAVRTRERRRRRSRRRWTVGVAAVGALVLVGGVGASIGGVHPALGGARPVLGDVGAGLGDVGGGPGAPPSAASTAASAVPGAVVDEDETTASSEAPDVAAGRLTVRRLELVADLTRAVLSGGAPDDEVDVAQVLTEVTLDGSAAHTQAVGLVESLVANGTRLDGTGATVTATAVLSSSAAAAEVEVEYTVGAYSLVPTDGRDGGPGEGVPGEGGPGESAPDEDARDGAPDEVGSGEGDAAAGGLPGGGSARTAPHPLERRVLALVLTADGWRVTDVREPT